MTQARLKFWGWGRESEQLSGAEIAQLEKVYAGHFGVSRFEATPVGCPPEVGGVDIRRQPFLETVELVRPAEVHLAAERCLIAGLAQVVGECRHLRGKFGGVVISSDLRRELPGHEGKA